MSGEKPLLNEWFSFLATWDEIVSYAGELRGSRDDLSWKLGDLARYACNGRNPVGGRPRGGDEAHTVAAFANAIGELPGVVSEWKNNAEFWTPAERADLPPNTSWRQCAEARRRAGWKPGMQASAEHKQLAREWVYRFADNGINSTDGDRVKQGRRWQGVKVAGKRGEAGTVWTIQVDPGEQELPDGALIRIVEVVKHE